jgi:hypothetical protein
MKILCQEYQLPTAKTVHLLKGKLFALISFKDEDMA